VSLGIYATIVPAPLVDISVAENLADISKEDDECIKFYLKNNPNHYEIYLHSRAYDNAACIEYCHWRTTI